MVVPTPWRRAARAASRPVAAALAAPLVAVPLLAWAGLVPWRELLAARSALLWVACATLASIGALAIAVAERRLAAALAAAAVACMLGQGAAWLLLRGEATLDAGEGEESPPTRWLSSGLSARLPEIRALALPDRRSGVARVAVGGREIEAPVGREVEAGRGVAVTVEEVHIAPAFVVRHTSGAEAAGLVKLVPGVRDWFEAAPLPHRFYATLPQASGDEIALRGPIRLRVQRGKIRVAEKDVPVGEAVEIEGVSLAFGSGARWARIRVRRAPPPWLLGLAAILAGGAAVAGVVARRRA